MNNSFLLTVLFQELGYVGRCSFDMVLVGESIDNCRVEFIECNARWGGTSIPMTLVNRLNVNDNSAFCVKKIEVPGLKQLEFNILSRGIKEELYDPLTGRGRFILFNPARIKSTSSIDAIAIADTTKQAEELLTGSLTDQLTRMVQNHVPTDETAADGLKPN